MTTPSTTRSKCPVCQTEYDTTDLIFGGCTNCIIRNGAVQTPPTPPNLAETLKEEEEQLRKEIGELEADRCLAGSDFWASAVGSDKEMQSLVRWNSISATIKSKRRELAALNL